MPPSPVKPVDFSLTKYVEPIKDQTIAVLAEPFGPGYQVLFDLNVNVDGWKDIRVWVQVMYLDSAAPPVTAATQLELRLMHNFFHGSMDYEKTTIPWNGFTSYINGYAIRPVIGKQLRLLCHPVSLPSLPCQLTVTYLLVR